MYISLVNTHTHLYKYNSAKIYKYYIDPSLWYLQWNDFFIQVDNHRHRATSKLHENIFECTLRYYQ